jgi:hypothetical protein
MSPRGKQEKELRVVLKESTFKKLDKIRDYHGLKNMAEIVRFLITKEYREVQERDFSKANS